ncbi:MAG: PEP-CTERM sorting domain-containing protein [Phycisphaerales bacterium]
MKKALAIALIAGTSATAAGQVQFTEIMRTSISAATGEGNNWFIGRNVAAVAWDGTSLYVGGQSFNSAGSAIAKVTPQMGTTSGLFELSGNFGFQATAATRGIQDLAISADGRLAVATDNGAGATFGYRLFDTNGNLITDSNFNVRGNGVDFDPINGVAAGAVLGSGRLHGFNDDGSTFSNWDATTGPLLFTISSTNRDSEFDSDGNLYYRQQNAIHRIDRTGATTFGGPIELKASNSTNVNGQNLEIIEGFGDDLIIYTERLGTATGQNFGDVIQAIDSSGNAVSISFDFIDAFGDAATGNGYYDFSYDSASQTLAVADFLNNQVYIFAVPAPASAALLGLGGLAAARRRR